MILNMAQERREEGWAMKETFRIQNHGNSESLHLRLMGVFDCEAALLLMEALNENRARMSKIFVHTGALDQVLESDVELFRSRLGSLDRPGAEIIFTGERREEIAVKAPGIRFIK